MGGNRACRRRGKAGEALGFDEGEDFFWNRSVDHINYPINILHYIIIMSFLTRYLIRK